MSQDDAPTIPSEIEAKTAQLAGLRWLGRQIGTSLHRTEILSATASSIKDTISDAQSIIFLAKEYEDTSERSLTIEFADTPLAVSKTTFLADEGLLSMAISSIVPILVPDTDTLSVQCLLASDRSVVVAPLWDGIDDDIGSQGPTAGLLGCLYVSAAKQNALTEQHREFIETVSYLAAMALKNTRLYEQTQQMLLTDDMTGLCTFRLFQDKLSEEIESCERHKQSLVLVLMDVDNLGYYNLALGHPAGDALLKGTASLINGKVRPPNIVARYGGDEFALLLKNTDKDGAACLSEQIRETFGLRFGSNLPPVTLSIGLACYPWDADSKNDLIRAAHEALYLSKRDGRDRITVSKVLAARDR